VSTELEMIEEYMAGPEVPSGELRRAQSILDDVIASSNAATSGMTSGRRSRHLMRWSIGAAVAVAASAVLVIQILPTTRVATPEAAAAQLMHLASVVQPPTELQAGQWSTDEMRGVVKADRFTLGKTPEPNVQASIPLTLQTWSNSSGSMCTSETFGTATFASSTDAAAWNALGLIDTPANQPITGCDGGVEAAWDSTGPPVFDVSNLTHDPATLASELQNGNTGIPSLDQADVNEEHQVAGFIRLADLLVGPNIGQWSGFGKEILQTMSLLPGVVSLGDLTAHSNAIGPAFTVNDEVELNPKTGAVEWKWAAPIVILDAETGTLLEVRNISIPILQGAAQDFVGSPNAPVYTQGGGYGISTTWADPVGSPSVIDQGSLPGWISMNHLIEVVTLPTTTASQVSAVVNPLLSNGDHGIVDNGVPSPGVSTNDITIIGTPAQEATVVQALTNSGLFASVIAKY
jgi:hypothetical protein